MARELSVRQYRPAAAAFLLMMAMALSTTALSFFVDPVCEALGFGRGSFTVNYSILTATGMAASPLLGQFIRRRGLNGILTVCPFWVSGCLMVFSVAGDLWVFYAAAAVLGIFATSCVSLCASVIVQQSYSGPKASTILGIVMAGSGAGGMLISMVLPGILDAAGWRMGYRVVALGWLVLTGGARLLLGRAPSAVQETEEEKSAPNAFLKSRAFWILGAVIFLLSAGCGLQQHLPGVLGTYGLDTAQVSSRIALFTASLALGKIVQGVLYSRIGTKRGGIVTVAVFAAGFAMLRVPALAIPALIALAIGLGTVTTLIPVVTRSFFGDEVYASAWSILFAISNAGTLSSTPLYGLVRDVTGSYDLSLMVSVAVIAAALVLFLWAYRKKNI